MWAQSGDFANFWQASCSPLIDPPHTPCFSLAMIKSNGNLFFFATKSSSPRGGAGGVWMAPIRGDGGGGGHSDTSQGAEPHPSKYMVCFCSCTPLVRESKRCPRHPAQTLWRRLQI